MVRLAKKLLKIPGAIVLDTETTGFSISDEVIQLAIMGVDGRVLFNNVLRPYKAKIHPRAAAVHGIDQETADQHYTLSHYYHRFDTLYGRRVIAYNAGFDRRMMEQSCKIAGPDFLRVVDSWEWYDLMKPYAHYWNEIHPHYGSVKWQKLTAACEQQGIEVRDAHDALGDVKMTLALLKYFAEKE